VKVVREPVRESGDRRPRDGAWSPSPLNRTKPVFSPPPDHLRMGTLAAEWFSAQVVVNAAEMR
jgi:hypothetical protein